MAGPFKMFAWVTVKNAEDGRPTKIEFDDKTWVPETKNKKKKGKK